MFTVGDVLEGVVFGWQTALCTSPTFCWDKRENVWSKLCFIFIRPEGGNYCHIKSDSYNQKSTIGRSKVICGC